MVNYAIPLTVNTLKKCTFHRHTCKHVHTNTLIAPFPANTLKLSNHSKMYTLTGMHGCPQIWNVYFLSLLFFLNIVFIYSWETYTERQRLRQREKKVPCREPDAGLGPGSPGSHPGLKASAQLLSHSGIPRCHGFWNCHMSLNWIVPWEIPNALALQNQWDHKNTSLLNFFHF